MINANYVNGVSTAPTHDVYTQIPLNHENLPYWQDYFKDIRDMSSYFVRLISPVETSLLTESLRNGPREGYVPIVTNGGMMVVFINGFPTQFLTPIGELLNLALTD